MKPDLSDCTYAELAELRSEVHNRMSEMRETGITQLRATIAEQATLLGVELEELLPKKRRKRRKRDDDMDDATLA
jgi:hypothetical protein